MQYWSATTKAEAAARMYLLAGRPLEPLGPGSKEKKSALVALGAALDLDLEVVSGKTECGRIIAERLGSAWGEDCYSSGDTITMTGMCRLVDDAVGHLVKTPGRLAPPVLADILESARGAAARRPKEISKMPIAFSELEQNIAERLVLLSGPGPRPEGARGPVTPIAVTDVRFDDGAWRAVVEYTQDWMRLPRVVGGETPEEFDRALAEALPGEPTHVERGALLERLAERLERAVTLRDRFQDSVEGTVEGRATLETATQEWIDAWDEVEEEEEAEGGGPIKASADVWPINEFVQRAQDGELNLSPSYQRADVWPTSDSQMLIESVLRGIPLPSIILLQDDEGGVNFEVVDGKQRLTSILRFMGHHPHALEIVEAKAVEWEAPDLVDTFKRDYPSFKKLWKQKEQTRLTAQVERDKHFPFPLRSGNLKPLSGGLADLRGRYYSEVRDLQIDVVGKKQRVRSIFEQTSSYKVPVILYEEVSSEQIHEVFSLYNKQGKHLNAEEIRNARFHGLALMRGLLATAGDAEDAAAIAPFLVDDLHDLKSTMKTLEGKPYDFGRAGYKRTKLLSWVASVLFGESGTIGGRSTAATINALLARVEKDTGDVLRDEDVVRDAMLLLDHGLDAHAAVSADAWAPTFRTSQPKGGGWQELPLVSCLIALSAAQMALGDELVDRLEQAEPEVRLATEKVWLRPGKTQTTEQWRFTAGVVRGLLAILDVHPGEAEARLTSRFGHCGLGSLLSLKDPDEWTS